MSLFKTFFGKDTDDKGENTQWIPLQTAEDLNAAIAESFRHKAVIFKHSTRCGISRMVLKNLQNEMALDRRGAIFYYLDLLKFRPLSNQIAQDFGITHQSPQMIVLENGKPIAHASHNEVSTSII